MTVGKVRYAGKCSRRVIAVDWGTSCMRAMLCDPATPGMAQVIEGNGISKLRTSPANELLGAIEPWTEQYGKLDLLLGGMVGSNIGWRTTPYLACPLDVGQLAKQLLTFEEAGHHVAIVPGASCTNVYGQPDIMRGEEIQVCGWMRHNIDATDAILCLPGTHSKWVRVVDGLIDSFTSSITGEMFSLLREHSVLVNADRGAPAPFDEQAFETGVHVAEASGRDLLHIVFSTRTRQVVLPEVAGDPSSYLSGLLIGADIQSALSNEDFSGSPIEIVGAPELSARFAAAMDIMSIENNVSNGDEMVLAGFLTIAEMVS